MNKKFSTLLTMGLLAVGSLFGSAQAQTQTAGEYITEAKNLKNGSFVYLSDLQTASQDLSVLNGKSLVAYDSIHVFTQDTTIAQIDTMAWQVKVVAGALPTFQFVNRSSGKLLSVKAGQAHKEATLEAGGIDTWALGEEGLYAVLGDSTYYLTYGKKDADAQHNRLVLTAKKGVMEPLGAAGIAPRLIKTNVKVTATVFNESLKGFKFSAVTGRLANTPSEPSAETNILEDNEWVAFDLHAGGKYFKDGDGKASDTLLLMSKTVNPTMKDSLGFLRVDTGYIYGTELFALNVTADSSYFRRNIANGGLGSEYYKSGLDSLHMFKIKYSYYNDSIAIHPVALPVKTVATATNEGAEWWNGGTDAENVVLHHDADRDTIVGLKTLATTTVIAVGANEDAQGLNVADNQKVQAANITTTRTASDGDAKISAKSLYFWQIKNEVPAKEEDLYLALDLNGDEVAVEEASAYNPSTQWAIYESVTPGYYTIVNRATNKHKFTGPIYTLKDEDGKAIKDEFVINSDTVKLIAVDLKGLPTAKIEIDDEEETYNVSAYFYNNTEGERTSTFTIASASPYLSELAMQLKEDKSMVLGEEGVEWKFDEVDVVAIGAEVEGISNLAKATYKIYTEDAEGTAWYVYQNAEDDVYAVTKTAADADVFEMKAVAENTYVIIETDAAEKMTVNPQQKLPAIEASALTSEKSDYFTIVKSTVDNYRELGVTDAEDGLKDNDVNNAKIYMANEPTRFLYENTLNIVANNGKSDLNFLGVYNTAQMEKNAALFIDTAYVDRKDNTKYQYLIGLRQEFTEAVPGEACPVCGEKDCDHAQKGAKSYYTADYLVSLVDSADVKSHPAMYDGKVRLGFVPATHIGDSVIIDNSKFSAVKKEAKNDTLKISDKLNEATFALKIKDQETKSFLLENGGGYVQVLNGVPVLTTDITNAAVFNIEATEEEAVANDAIEAAAVKVVAVEGAIIVKGAAGKAVVVTNLLGQTIANTVITSDEATIAAPAGIVVVAVEGEAAVKAIVK